jgi:thiol-disulfide isomerase/thioredoxin
MKLHSIALPCVLSLLTLGAAPCLGAQATPPAPTAVPTPPATQHVGAEVIAADLLAAFDAQARSEASVAKANGLLVEIANAYRTVPTLTDTMTLTIESLGNSNSLTFAVALGKGSDARLAMQGATMIALDGQMTLIADEPADRVLRVPLKGDLINTLRETLPNFAPPVTMLDLRAGRPLTSEALGLLALENPRVAGLRQVTGASEILVVGDNGASLVTVDASTKLIASSKALFTPPGAPAGMVMQVGIVHETKVAEAFEAPLAVHIGNRRIVTSLEEYMPTMRMIAVGEPVPAWTMRGLDGATVSLADLKGSVVVLDFWASYCAPCKRAMPYVDEFAKWAESSGKPIRVFAVNTLESGDAAGRVETASAWWSEQHFTLGCLMDIDDGVAESMGIRVMPTTLIIGPDGVLRAIHQAFDPARPGALVDELKAAAEKALAGQH